MSFDLSELLRDWPYEPGQLQVRKIEGADGRPKIQLRLDMGVLQMEVTGRPDGQTPEDCESLHDFHQQRAKNVGAGFQLTPDEIGDMQAEGIQYYHRYLAFFQMGDWQSVVRDTKRNLDMFTFVAKYAPGEELSWSVQQFRPYVLMMNTRAKAHLALDKDDMESAIALVEKGIASIERFLRDSAHDDEDGDNAEATSLREWLKELREKKPLSPLEKLRREMEQAVNSEQYERAAKLRDEIKAMQASE